MTEVERVSPPRFFSFYFLRLQFPSPESSKNGYVSLADCPAPVSALCAVCAPVTLSFVSGPLAWWPQWLSGSSVPRALACSPRGPPAWSWGLRGGAAGRLGMGGAHALLWGFEFQFRAAPRQSEVLAASSSGPGPSSPALRAVFRGGRLLTRHLLLV